MRVPDAIPQCAAFIYARDSSGDMRPVGTAFFVSVPSVFSYGVEHIYLITAKHLLRMPDITLRYNRRDGQLDQAALPNAALWYESIDTSVDIAALLLDETFDWLSEVAYKPIPLAILCTDEVMAEDDVGIGDELLVTGLLASHPGEDRNIPIVRSGIVSALSVHGLVDKPEGSSTPFVAHLVELRSTGGLSGSPVFVVIGPARMVSLGGNTTWDVGAGVGMIGFRLLGVIRGHWYTIPRDANKATQNAMYDSDQEGINRGIAKVTPAKFLYEILMTGKALEDRVG